MKNDQTQSLPVHCRTMESADGAELYLTAALPCDGDIQEQARQIYTQLANQLKENGMHIFCERLFATKQVIPEILVIRKQIFHDIDDGVPPTPLVVDPGSYGDFAGVQIHAVRGDTPPDPLCFNEGDGEMTGRQFKSNGHHWVSLNNLAADIHTSGYEQTKQIFNDVGAILNQAGGSMNSVARTWLWLKDVCGWYDQLNAARTEFFKTEGLIDVVNRKTRLPASTGIGMYGVSGGACTLDLIAMPGLEDQIEFIEAGGDQHSAFEYGSAFSRASIAPMPGGKTLFISGTAAIDEEGITEEVGQIEAQINNTITHARALLADAKCGDEHVLTSLIYCKTPQVEQVFRKLWPDLSWPNVVMIGDVCRPELLFEVEVTASPDLVCEA